MKFRILSGINLISTESELNDLETLYNTNNLRIEVSNNTQEATNTNGQRLICIGNLIGLQKSLGGIEKLESPAEQILSMMEDISFDDMCSRLEGRFLLILINSDGSCLIGRDRFAKIDIYTQFSGDEVALVSDLSCLSEPHKDGYDQAALVHTLTYYGFRPPKKHTIYKSVRRLGVGDTASITNGKLSVETKEFKPIEIADYTEQNNNDYADMFLSHLENAGSHDGNIVYLSSGWDSTSILAGLVHIFGKSKVRAIIGRMRYSDRSGVCNQFEIDRATKMAEYYGINLDIVEFEYLENGPEFIQKYAPLMKDQQAYASTILTHGILAEAASKIVSGNETIFAGEISDGAHNLGFSQYATIFHPVRDFQEYSDKMASYLFGPTFLSSFQNGKHDEDFIYKLFLSMKKDSKFDELDSDPAKRTGQLLTSFFLRNGRMPLWSLDNVEGLTPDGRDLYTDEMFSTYLSDAAEKATPETIYAWYLHLYNSFHWQGSTVNTLSLFADEFNLKSDIPYWDGGIQNFLSAMPENWGRGLDLNNTKYPLKWMLRNKIDYPYEMQEGPHAYTYDVDSSFNHTNEIFYHSKMKDIFQDALRNKDYHQILSSKVFNLEHYDSIVDDYLHDKELSVSQINELWPLTNLCLFGWYGK